jgi:hypothetical protein
MTAKDRLRSGTVVEGRFLVESEAGAGGMGVVYRAVDRTTHELVALKLLTQRGEVDVSRFARERSILAQLGHPGIVRYVDHGRTAGGQAYLAMEWLEGETLAHRLRTQPLSIGKAVRVVRNAALALGAAHAAGIVHRDVKPANLFLVDGDVDRVKVLDFGIARRLDDESTTLTTTGTVLGTPYYMAPEQARGLRNVDARVDVYALGCVLFEALTGTRPFDHESLVAVLAAVLLEEPPSARERAHGIPATLDALVARMLSKRADARPKDGHAAADALEDVTLTGTEGAAKPSLAPPALTEREQRVVCVVLVGGASSASDSARTMVSGSDDLEGSIRSAVEALGASVVALADGSVVATVEEAGGASDQAARAARCAIAIREVAPTAAIAVSAARALVRGRAPVGEGVQRSADLLRASSSAEERARIRLDSVVAGLLDARFVVSKLGERHFLESSRRDPDSQRSRLGRAPSSFVGREREMSVLGLAFDEASEEPIARVALVTAPPGAGKTRLGAELMARLEARGARLLFAQGDALAASAPFWLAAELVRSGAGIADGEPLELRREKLSRMAEASASGIAGVRIATMLGELCRVPFPDDADDALLTARRDPVLRGDLERRAFEDWLEGESRIAPVAIVIDDLQHADRSSLALLDGALRHLAARPIFLVGLARPELEESFPGLFAEREPQRIPLARLLPRAARALVSRALGETSGDETIARIVDRGDGNPLYLEELARAVREGDDALPTSVLAMVESRLSVLDPETRRVARAASVFGLRAPVDGTRELVGRKAIDEHLRVLDQRDILGIDARATGAEAWVLFRQPLVREAAYAMLTEEDRLLGHRLAGEWLSQHAQVEPSVLAQHFERGGVGESAARHWGRAADQALSGDDLAGALDHARRGLVLAQSDAVRGPLLAAAALAHRWRAEYPAAFSQASAALSILTEGESAYFDAASTLLSAAAQLGRRDEATPLRDRLHALEVPLAQRPAQIVALCRAASHELATLDRAAFDRRMARADALFASLDRRDPLARAWIRTLRASAAFADGDLSAFVEGTSEAVISYELAGDARDACNQRVRLGNGLVSLGAPGRALAELEKALADAERMGLRLVIGYALQNLGHARALAGDRLGAESALARAIELGRALDDAILEAGARLYASDLAREHGQLATAMREAETALARTERIPGFSNVARATLSLALGHDPSRALEEAERAQRTLPSGTTEGEARIWLALATAQRALGDPAAGETAGEALRRVEERGARIAEGSWRESFLYRVPEHARLREIASPSRT